MSDTLYKMANSPYAPGTLAHTSYYKPSGAWPTSSGSGTTGSKTPTTPTDTVEAPKLPEGQEYQDYFDQDSAPYYTPQSEDRMSELANQFREIYEEPKRAEIESRLEQAIADALAQEERVGANYAGLEDSLRRREVEQMRYDLESAISRGGGRSGVVPHLGQNRDRYYSELLMGEKAKEMAELNAIASQLGLTQRQVPRELIELSEQAARIEAQELQRLRDLDYQRGMDYDMDQFARSLQVFDRSNLTPLERLQLYIEMANVAGNWPAAPPSVYGTVPSGWKG